MGADFVQKLVILFALCCLPLFSTLARAQKPLSAEDRAAIAKASVVADAFIAKFRQTRDFTQAWKAFRRQDIRCTVRANGVVDETMRRRLKLSDAYLEKVYGSAMNFYFLRWAYGLTLHRMSDGGDEWSDPESIVAYEKKARFLGNDTEDPKTLFGLRRMILEMDHVSALFRKHMPRDVMRNEIWRANIRWFEEQDPSNHVGIEAGSESLCVPASTKTYTFERGPFYFYFIREKGTFKIAAFGID